MYFQDIEPKVGEEEEKKKKISLALVVSSDRKSVIAKQ